LHQAVERVSAELIIRQFVSRSFAFANAGTKYYLVSGETTSGKIKIHFYNLDVKEVWENLWHQIHAQADSQFFCSDAAWLWHALKSVEINPMFCRVHFLGQSVSSVYDVTMPSILDHIDKDKSMATKQIALQTDQRREKAFVMKVVRKSDAFQKELKALQKVKPFFFLGYIDFRGKEARAFQPGENRSLIFPYSVDRADHLTITQMINEREAQVLASLNSMECWWCNGPTVPSEGGVIFMKVGVPVDQQTADPIMIFRDCCESLDELHSVGIYHRDCRIPNIMRFIINSTPRYLMIDYGMAGEEKDLVRVTGRDARTPLLPGKARKALGSDRHAFVDGWKEKEDIEMLANACMQFMEKRFKGIQDDLQVTIERMSLRSSSSTSQTSTPVRSGTKE